MTSKATRKCPNPRRPVKIRRSAADKKRPVFLVTECKKTHHVKVRANGSNRAFGLVQDTGSENTYIDLEIANAWGLMRGTTPLVPFQHSSTVDSNGTIHKSIRLKGVNLEILCPDGVFRGSVGPVEVNLNGKSNKFGRLYGVGHMRTLIDTVHYITVFTDCRRRRS